jgi:hypothetical protein
MSDSNTSFEKRLAASSLLTPIDTLKHLASGEDNRIHIQSISAQWNIRELECFCRPEDGYYEEDLLLWT